MRFCAIFLALLAVYGLRPASGLWHRRWLAGNVCDRAAAAVLGLVLAAFVVVIPFWEPSNTGLATKDYNTAFWDGESTVSFVYQQYGALAHSLLNGRLDLEADPPSCWRWTTPTMPGRATPRKSTTSTGTMPFTMGATTSILALYRVFCSSCRLRH